MNNTIYHVRETKYNVLFRDGKMVLQKKGTQKCEVILIDDQNVASTKTSHPLQALNGCSAKDIRMEQN